MPVQRHVLLHPGLRRTELIERIMHGFQDTFQPVERANRRQTWVESVRWVPRALIQPRVLQAARKASRNRWPASWVSKTAKIVQQREVKAGVRQVETEGILPIHAAADGIGALAGEPLDVLHYHHQCQAPGRHSTGRPGADRDWQELIIVERAELGTELHIEVAFGKSGPHGSRSRVWNGGRGSGRKLMAHLRA